MNDTSTYQPPKVWEWQAPSGGKFANINRPIAGATHEKSLPVGAHRFQLYSMATPNGVKVTHMLEELLERGAAAEYDAWTVNIFEGEQFASGFVDINPNSKIPALVDKGASAPVRVFESGSILVYLAEQFDSAFLPSSGAARAETLNWLFWQMGSAPFLGGGFGHFYAYAPTKIEYAINRFTMEVKRQLDVLNQRLANSRYLAGEQFTIADIATWPWYGWLVMGRLYNAETFLDVGTYSHVKRWADEIQARPAAQRGMIVNRVWGDAASQMRERHGSADFAGKRVGVFEKI